MQRGDKTNTAGRGTLLTRLWRHRGLFLGIFGAVMVLAVGALLVLPVRYVAVGSVIVAEQEPGITNASPAWAEKIGDPADLESQLLVIRSPRVMRLATTTPGVLDAVLRECRHAAESGGLGSLLGGHAASCDKLKPDSDDLIELVSTRYSVGSVGRSRVINISYQSPLPDVAKIMADALITAFLDDQRTSLSSGREVAATWLWQELKQLDGELADEDAKIQAYRRSKGLMRGANAPITSERLTSISQQLSGAQAARAEAAARLEEIKTDQARGSTDASAVLASRTVADIKQQMAVLQQQLAGATSLLGERHPTRLALEHELGILQQRLAQEVETIAANSQKALTAADALVASLKQQTDEVKAEVAAATADEASIQSMVRDVEIKRQQYSELYKRASELETERRVMLGSTRLVSLAELPTKPFFPKRVPFLAAGLTFALLLSFGAVLLRERSDRSIRAASDLALATGVPIMAQLPQMRAGRALSLRSFFTAGAKDLPLGQALEIGEHDAALQDALRRLHAGLLRTGSGRKPRTILITSAAPGEGKTFTTLALARFIAAGGRRVLVLDCDTQRQALEGALRVKDRAGLTDILNGSIDPGDAVVRVTLTHFHIIPAGRATVAADDAASAERIAELLQWAQSYDFVLIDSPSGALMDAFLESPHLDGVLCCTRWGATPIAEALTTTDWIKAAGGDLLGVVLTMVDPQVHGLYEPAIAPAPVYLKAS